jgi:hypothetical protein
MNAKTAYTQDLGSAYTHGWLSQIKNTWNVKNWSEPRSV